MADDVKEFDQVVKPAPPPSDLQEQPRPPPTPQIDIPQTAAYKKFMGETNDAYIEILKKLSRVNEFNIDVDGASKTYLRHKIKGKEYTEIEKLRAKYATLTEKRRFEEASDIYIEIYEKCALYYLGMSKQDFENGDLEEIKKVCDACSHRTLFPLPN